MNEEQLEQLLKASGARPQPGASTAEDIRRATEAAWLEAVATNRRIQRGMIWRWVGAAMVVLACGGIAFVTLNPRISGPPAVLAHAVQAKGDYWVNGRAGGLNTPIVKGDIIGTKEAGLATLLLRDSTHITLAPDTQLKFDGPSQLHLVTGRVYVDSASAAASVAIVTTWGKVEDIGTQFEVSVNPAELRVAMREGKVKMSLANGTHLAQYDRGFGDVIAVDSALNIRRTSLAADDEHWNWVLPGVAPLHLEGLTVYQLMQWTSRTTGKPVVYASAAVEAEAKRIRLSGGKLAPEQINTALPYILKTTTLVAHIGDDKIEIGTFSQL